MQRWILVLLASSSLMISGCASKKYVRQQTGPIIQQVNELDELTARNTNDIRDLEGRTEKGLQQVNAQVTAVDQKAGAAEQRASEAQTLASSTAGQVNALENRVVNLDDYHPLVETTVHFGFDKDVLTKKAKQALDMLAKDIPDSNYILEVIGSTDSVGNPVYNYELSKRRAAAVIQYLSAEHSVPAHKFFVVGLGKDDPAASNSNRSGRAENRRVQVRLLTNQFETQPAQASLESKSSE